MRSTLLRSIAIIAVSGACLPVSANRILTTPFAETLKAGDVKTLAITMKESRTTENWRNMQRLDIGLTDSSELGVLNIDPHSGPTTTWLNLQQRVARETATTPTVSVGVWDAGRIDEFSGQKSGGSFFIAASKTVNTGTGHLPIKLNIGAGTNRLNGFFGGAVVPITTKTGLLFEYSPKNLRLPKTDAVNIAYYYRPKPDLQLRASWVGGNPMLDIAVSTHFGGGKR